MRSPSDEYVEAHYVGLEIIGGKGYMSAVAMKLP
jgi:hypothetical protein